MGNIRPEQAQYSHLEAGGSMNMDADGQELPKQSPLNSRSDAAIAAATSGSGSSPRMARTVSDASEASRMQASTNRFLSSASSSQSGATTYPDSAGTSSATSISSPPSPSPSRRTGLISRFKNRRPSRARNTSLSQSPVAYASEELDHTALTPQVSTSAEPLPPLPLPPSAESPYIPGVVPRTPEEERDAMLEERRHARELIEAALAQARTDLNHITPSTSIPILIDEAPGPSSSPGASSRPIIRDVRQSERIRSDQEGCNAVRHLASDLPGQTLGSEHAMQTDYAEASSSMSIPVFTDPDVSGSATRPSTPTRLFASLPRRGRSTSPSPVSQNPSQDTGAMPNGHSIEPETAPAITDTWSDPSTPPSGTEMSPLLIPRRILVQGIVARSPSMSPASSSRPRTPASRRTAASLDSSATPSSSETQEYANGGFWGELPGVEAIDDNARAAGTDMPQEVGLEDSSNGSWDNVVRELLALPNEGSETVETEEAAVTPDVLDEDPLGSIEHQATLIGRLLSIAAAATAATLLPGAITINGTAISGFDDNDPSSRPANNAVDSSTRRDSASIAVPPASSPQAPARPRSSSMDAIPLPSMDSLAPLASEGAGTNTTGGSLPALPEQPQSSSAGTIQEILRSALAAAFRTPPLSPQLGTAVTTASPITSPPLSSPPNIPRLPQPVFTPASTPNQPGPSFSGAPSPSPQPAHPASRSTSNPSNSSLAIPINVLQADPRLTSGASQPQGTFERFLADLQTEYAAQ